MAEPAFHDDVGAAPDARAPHILWLLFGVGAAPIAWLGQVMLGYGVTALVCYPGDHPVMSPSPGLLFVLLLVCDAVALAGCAAGGIVAWRGMKKAARARDRFLAQWAILSSLCFFAAILFNVIASLAVPPCLS